jgi:hypothetical protein
MKKFLALLVAVVCVLSLSAPAFAGNVTESGSSTSIPVQLTATATTFSVDVPTAFPVSLDPTTGETTESNTVVITNNSAGSIVVSSIVVNRYDDWHLADFDADLKNASVDSNQIGVSVQPFGGRNAGEGGAVLKTNSSSTETQTLLSAADTEWIIDANDGAEDGSDELRITYDTNATPVSAAITNKQVATIVITVAWNSAP